jgi:hypothetical protein
MLKGSDGFTTASIPGFRRLELLPSSFQSEPRSGNEVHTFLGLAVGIEGSGVHSVDRTIGTRS